MAEAGFIYLGLDDCVKCWYCGGGLKNWEVAEEPWCEHAKHFPSCEFVLQNTGKEYVQKIVNQFPHVKKPRFISN